MNFVKGLKIDSHLKIVTKNKKLLRSDLKIVTNSKNEQEKITPKYSKYRICSAFFLKQKKNDSGAIRNRSLQNLFCVVFPDIKINVQTNFGKNSKKILKKNSKKF